MLPLSSFSSSPDHQQMNNKCWGTVWRTFMEQKHKERRNRDIETHLNRRKEEIHWFVWLTLKNENFVFFFVFIEYCFLLANRWTKANWRTHGIWKCLQYFSRKYLQSAIQTGDFCYLESKYPNSANSYEKHLLFGFCLDGEAFDGAYNDRFSFIVPMYNFVVFSCIFKVIGCIIFYYGWLFLKIYNVLRMFWSLTKTI